MMPVYEERTTSSAGSNTSMFLTFLPGFLIILIVVLVILQSVLHVF